MNIAACNSRRGFSLIELVIVVVILGIIGAIAIPRMSRGSAGASDSALTSDLAVLRSGIDLYATEHGGTFPTVANFVNALTQYSDVAGSDFGTKTTDRYFGPYLRAIPALPVGAKKGNSGVAAADAAGVGWIYVESTGEITANCADTETDAAGTKYNAY